ncbi:RluA family pseudouridine synthase [Paenibacillaceae bacterium]|nr:RluA family pseudouridine synthase [Paenibacillaceae bacterium]
MKRNNLPPRKKQPESYVYRVESASELLQFVLEKMNAGRNAVKSMLARGQISVDGKPIKVYNHPLQPGQTVAVSKNAPPEAPAFIGLTIIYEDKDIIVIRKEAGLLSVASDKGEELTAYRQLTAHVRTSQPTNRIFVVHRLDRDTSGLMMFAKTEAVKLKLQNEWQDLIKERIYVALVEGKVRKKEGTVSSWLKESKTLKMYSSFHEGDGQHAVTHYRVLQTSSRCSLLEVQLETGRKNQIRVHMEDIGHPVSGDKKYGARAKIIGRLGLHARVLAFTHPTSAKDMRFETDIPPQFLKPFIETSSPELG